MSDQETRSGSVDGKVYVWDVPTRLFHWVLVGAVATSLFAGEFGYMDIHVISGHVVLALVLFRIVWGVVGGRHARFADFIKGPGAVIGYLRSLLSGNAPWHAGHNPMGALSVVALLLVLAAQVGTGLFANDDILTEGPLASTVDKSLSDTLTYWHEISGKVLYTLIGLHLAAIAFYTFKGEDIVRAMVTGSKKAVAGAVTERNAKGSLIVALVAAALAAAVAYAIKNY